METQVSLPCSQEQLLDSILTLWNIVPLEKLTVAQLLKKFLALMETAGSFLCSQKQILDSILTLWNTVSLEKLTVTHQVNKFSNYT